MVLYVILCSGAASLLLGADCRFDPKTVDVAVRNARELCIDVGLLGHSVGQPGAESRTGSQFNPGSLALSPVWPKTDLRMWCPGSAAVSDSAQPVSTGIGGQVAFKHLCTFILCASICI